MRFAVMARFVPVARHLALISLSQRNKVWYSVPEPIWTDVLVPDAFSMGTPAANWCDTTSVNTAEQHPTRFAGHPHRSLALDTRTQEDLAAEGLGNWLLPV